MKVVVVIDSEYAGSVERSFEYHEESPTLGRSEPMLDVEKLREAVQRTAGQALKAMGVGAGVELTEKAVPQ